MPLFGQPNIQKMKQRSDIEGLKRALHSKDPNIVREASFALGDLKIIAPVGLLIGITNPDWKIRREAYILFASASDRGFIPALASLYDPNEMVRMAGMMALLYKNEKRAVRAIEGCLIHDPSFFVRKCAAIALKKLGGPQSIKVLLMATQDEHPEVREVAIESLSELGY